MDGKNAVGAAATLNGRKGKLVATNATTGRLPNNIIAKAPDANLLDGLDSTDFLGATAAAGGDLTGTYPSPEIAAGAITSDEIADGQVRAADLGTLATFRRRTPPQGEEVVLRLGGLEISYACVSLNGTPQLTARTAFDDAYVDLGFTTGAEGFGSSFFAADINFNTASTFDLDRGAAFGRGTLVYARSDGAAVTLTYGFDGVRPFCLANGVAVGG